MTVSLNSLFTPSIIIDVVSRMDIGQGRIGKFLGFHYGLDAPERGSLMGPNSKEVQTRSGLYDIFDTTRTVAKGRAPGTGPATTPPQAIGQAAYTCARFHEAIPLEYEALSNMRPIGGPTASIDAGGQQYIAEQMRFIAQRFNNAIEILAAGVVRGKLYLKSSGDDLIPVLSAPGSGPYVEMDFKVPSGNQNQANMLGAGNIISASWATAGTKIIDHLSSMFDACAQLYGSVPTDAFCSPAIWSYIINNTQVINVGGSAQTPFEYVRYADDTLSNGKQTTEMIAVLRAFPTLKWHIVTDHLVLDGTDTSYASGTGTLTRVLPANDILLVPPADGSWLDLLHYGEYVSAAPGLPAVKRPSYFMWTETQTRPSVVNLLALMNAVPRLRRPKCLVRPTVVF